MVQKKIADIRIIMVYQNQHAVEFMYICSIYIYIYIYTYIIGNPITYQNCCNVYQIIILIFENSEIQICIMQLEIYKCQSASWRKIRGDNRTP